MISHSQPNKPRKTYRLPFPPRINMLKEEWPEDHESQLLGAAEATAEVRHIGVSIYLSIYLVRLGS